MHVTEILTQKGSEVATVEPTSTVGELISGLAEYSIGALVVSSDGKTIDGIVSERDVVRRLNDEGLGLLTEPVSRIMTSSVRTCSPSDTVEGLMGLMTEHRIRHLPVAENDKLVGIISIGDVVRWRVLELEVEAKHLADYIQSSW